MEDKVKEILCIVLDLPQDVEISNVRRINTPAWDSLAQASIIAGIESEFDISLDTADFERITSFESACLLLQEKIK